MRMSVRMSTSRRTSSYVIISDEEEDEETLFVNGMGTAGAI